MRASNAIDIARQWVETHGPDLRGYIGAYTAGSINDLPADAEISATSDVDVTIVLDDPDIGQKPGKVRAGGVLLELSYQAAGELTSPEDVLAHYHLARSVWGATILADPEGVIVTLKETVARDFADPEWVARRIGHAGATVLSRIDSIANDVPFHERVMSWLFAAGGVPHILLVAGLRNPTVRKRYLAVREMLEEIGRAGVYPNLLEMLGCRDWTPERASRHLDALEDAFDDASSVVRTPFFFAADIAPDAKPVAIGGSRELIAQGDHLEAVFWIVATWCRCQMVLHTDAPGDMAHAHDSAFAALVADLGINTDADLMRRGEDIREAMPGILRLADEVASGHLRGGAPTG